jgi:hypothetical protein
MKHEKQVEVTNRVILTRSDILDAIRARYPEKQIPTSGLQIDERIDSGHVLELTIVWKERRDPEDT